MRGVMLDPDDGQILYRYMLHRQVMVVAKMRIEGAWKAYAFPVPGKNHEREWQAWRTEGVQLTEEIARSMFGFLENIPYAL